MFETLQPASYGVATAFFVVSTITIFLRMYSRFVVVRSAGWDDWCMFAILVFNCGQQAMLYYFLANGAGLHIDIVLADHPEWLTNLVYSLFVEEIYYVWMHWIIKMCFLLFYVRFVSKGFFKHAIYATMAINTLFTVATWLIYCLQCIPLDAYFNKAAHPNVQCLDNSILYFVPASFSIFVDCLILILPIWPLWQIQTTLRRRLLLISIVSLGSVSVLVSMLRLIVLREFQTSPDFTYTLGKMIIISSIEIEVAIMAANGPSLKAIWTKHVGKTGYAGKSRYGQTHELSNISSNLGPRRQKIPSDTSYPENSKYSAMQHGQGKEWENDSEEKLCKRDIGILVTSTVGIETHDANSAENIRSYHKFDKV